MAKNRFSILLIFAISFLLPYSYAYSCYNEIVEADFLTKGKKYEAADTEGLFADKHKLAAAIPHPSAILTFTESNISAFFEDLSLPAPLIRSTSDTLRC